MRKFSLSVDIAAPPARVAEVMCDPFRWNEWTPSIKRVTPISEGPFGVGSTAMVHQPRLLPARWLVTAIEPSGFTWVSKATGIHVTGRHYVEPIPMGGRATLSIEYAGALGGVIAAMLGGITQRYIAMEAAGLKARSENPAYRL